MFPSLVDRTLQGMRRRLMFVIAAAVLAGAGCASADPGAGTASPPTGTTLLPAHPESGALPVDGFDSEGSP
jgi:hypothetical protein